MGAYLFNIPRWGAQWYLARDIGFCMLLYAAVVFLAHWLLALGVCSLSNMPRESWYPQSSIDCCLFLRLRVSRRAREIHCGSLARQLWRLALWGGKLAVMVTRKVPNIFEYALRKKMDNYKLPHPCLARSFSLCTIPGQNKLRVIVSSPRVSRAATSVD